MLPLTNITAEILSNRISASLCCQVPWYIYIYILVFGKLCLHWWRVMFSDTSFDWLRKPDKLDSSLVLAQDIEKKGEWLATPQRDLFWEAFSPLWWCWLRRPLNGFRRPDVHSITSCSSSNPNTGLHKTLRCQPGSYRSTSPPGAPRSGGIQYFHSPLTLTAESYLF